jgi:hypothetical protein
MRTSLSAQAVPQSPAVNTSDIRPSRPWARVHSTGSARLMRFPFVVLICREARGCSWAPAVRKRSPASWRLI